MQREMTKQKDERKEKERESIGISLGFTCLVIDSWCRNVLFRLSNQSRLS